MDQCCNIIGSVKFDELILSPTTVDDVSILTTIKLLQSLFVYECAFLDGASLMESVSKCVFTWKESWVHMENKKNISQRSIYIFCKSLMISISHLFTTYLAADVFEG
jgi:hypothetical protein